LNCPLCKEPMIVLELDEVEIDHCLSCGGIWLDAGELELLLEDAAQKDAFLSSFETDRSSKEKTIKCPVCKKKMDKILVGADQEIQIDRCRRNDGIWLDEGELEEILKMSSFGQDNTVLTLLKDMFAKKTQ
jgi:Zn-finger nucleic acid-binding protein